VELEVVKDAHVALDGEWVLVKKELFVPGKAEHGIPRANARNVSGTDADDGGGGQDMVANGADCFVHPVG
jgi:hypothetical protein